MSNNHSQSEPDSALEKLFYQSDRVQFLYWREFSGIKSTVHLAGVTAILAFITGLSNLSQPDVPLDGPFAVFVPGVDIFVRFGGVFFAFILAAIVFGLNRRRRISWYGAITVLPALTILPLATLQTNDIPLFLFTVLTIGLLIRNRDEFDQPLDLSPLQIASLSSVIGVLAYGTIGSYGMRDRYIGIETWTDAVYYVIVTVATVGYGDATPIAQETKWFTLSFIIIGTGAFTVAIGSLLIPAIESRMAAAVGHMKPSDLELLEDHILVLGYGDLTEPLLDELGGDIDVLVVTTDPDIAAKLKEDDIAVLTEDPTDKEVLRAARIGSARGVVVATEDDAHDVLAIIAAKQMRPDVRVVAASQNQLHIDKLESVGADIVISPTRIAGKILGESVLEESSNPDS